MSKTTAADILRERAEARASCRLAHTSNGEGDFYARYGCPCYTCRDALDPTGEEDARLANEEYKTPPRSTPFPMPSEPPKLMRQSASTGTGAGGYYPVEDLRSASVSGTSTTGHLFPSSRAEPDHIADAIASLKLEIAKLEEQQEEVYEQEAERHDEMAALDALWEEYDAKILTLQRVIDTLEGVKTLF